MRIDLIRHGECTDQAFLRGQTHSILSDEGQQQILAVLDALTFVKAVNKTGKIKRPGLFISSPAKRCADFMKSYVQADLEMLQIWPEFQERNFGVWDGLTYEAIQAQDPQGLESYLQRPFSFNIPQAESYLDFEQRVQSGWDKLLLEMNSPDINVEQVVMMTHGGVIRTLLKQFLGLSNEALFQLEIGYGARIRLEVFATTSTPFIRLVEMVQNPLNCTSLSQTQSSNSRV